MEKEIWKDIKGFEGHYEISSLGRVKSLKFGTEKILKHSYDTRGYKQVVIYKKGKLRKSFKVHTLVAIAFLNHKPDGTHKLEVNHINIINTDNRVENLELITSRENGNKKHIKSSSKYIGVGWHKAAKKWKASIHVNGKSKYLGVFSDELEASNAYNNELEKINNKICQ